MASCRRLTESSPKPHQLARDDGIFQRGAVPHEIQGFARENGCMHASGRPADVNEISELISQWVKLSGGHFSWVEQSKVKADMMNVPTRWRASRVTPSALRERCQAVGLSAADAAKIADWLGWVQAGRRLVPHRSYRAFHFMQEPTDG
jgi:hypothetical protein